MPEPGQYEELGLRFVGLPAEAGSRRDRLLSGELGAARLVRAAAPPRGAARRDVHRVLRASSTCTPRSRPSTGTFYRAVFGLPLLVLVAFGEWRRHGPLPRKTIRLAAIAGLFFTGDLMFWHHAIEAVGAGLATVLGNLQVIIVGFFAWLLLGERPSRATLLALPIVLAGVILISGVVGERRVRRGAAARGHPRHRDRDLLLGVPADHPAGAAAIRAGRRARWRSRRSSWCSRRSWSARSVGDLDLTPGPAEPVLAGDARDHRAVGRLPADLDLAAAAAGDHHLGHPAEPAGDVDGPGDRAARRDAVGDPAARRRRSSSAGSPARRSRLARLRDG